MSEKDYISSMNAYYEARAGLHDDYMSFVSNKEMEKLLGAIIRLIEKDIENKNILEIACGTGNWTTVLARRARHVTASDSSESMLKLARGKLADFENIDLIQADAYNLEELRSDFNCAFSSDWWSHIPRGMIRDFLNGLHTKLEKGAEVIFIDTLQVEDVTVVSARKDEFGNLIQRRVLPDGRTFDILKNLPAKSEIENLLSDIATDIVFHKNIYLSRWVLTYRLR
jgi:ubiquinone/menaquinone biosynthesis C-methylase UbiE